MKDIEIALLVIILLLLLIIIVLVVMYASDLKNMLEVQEQLIQKLHEGI